MFGYDTHPRAVTALLAVALSLLVVPAASAQTCPSGTGLYTDAVLATPDLAGYWRLGEAAGPTACAAAGTSGTYQDGSPLVRPGAVAGDADTAIELDGSRHVTVPDGPELDVGDTFTIEAWVMRRTTGGSANQVIASKQNRAWVLMFNPDDRLMLRKSNVDSVVSSTVRITDTSNWHHVAATKSGAVVKLYIDGAEVGGPVADLTMEDNALPLAIGISSGIAQLRGLVDEVALYRRALTPAEIATHRDLGVAPPAPAGVAATSANAGIEVTWSAPAASDVAGYRVYRRNADGSWPQTPTATTTSTSYLDRGLTSGSTYTHRVTAVDTAGNESPPSGEPTTIFTGTCSPADTPYARAVSATSGLVAHWRLGEPSGTTVCDATLRHDGTYGGGRTLGRPGALAGDPDPAVGFHGWGYGSIPDAPALDVGDDFTVEAWVRRERVSTSWWQVIASKQGGSWVLMFDSDNRLTLRRSGTGNLAHSTVSVADTSAWHHVAATKDGATVRLYVDGVEATGPVQNQTMADNDSTLEIGRSSATAHFDGDIDEVSLYDVALPASAVRAHLEAGTAPKPPTGLTATAGNRQVALDWADNAEADFDRYRVYRRNPDGSWPAAPLAEPATSAFTDTGLQNGTAYTYKVTAVDDDGNSQGSSQEISSQPVGCGSLVSQYSNTIEATPGLQLYLRLGDGSGTLACASAGLVDGAFQGIVSPGRPGAPAGDPDTAVGFTGGGSVDVPDHPTLDTGDRFSVEAWVRRSQISTQGNQVVASKQGGSWVLMFDSADRLVLRRAKVADVVASTAALKDTSGWHHVAATKDGSAVKLYLDGADVTGPVSNQTMIDNDQPLSIGQSSNTARFYGDVDEVAVYNRALSRSELTARFSRAAAPAGSSLVTAVGDIACASQDPNYNGGNGTATACRHKATANLIDPATARVLPLGDIQYEAGSYQSFLDVYHPTWGATKAIQRPVPGNHEYLTAGAAGYFDYFNGPGNATGPAGDRSKGYYSFDLGAWHIVSLNTECGQIGGCNAGSPQEQWLRADLQGRESSCVLAYMHRPRFTSHHGIGGTPEIAPLWKALHDHRAELVVAGHAHSYERFAPMTSTGVLDPATGIRSFTAGTGGKSLHALTDLEPTLEASDDDNYGLLELFLGNGGRYAWRFVPEPGGTFVDAGRGTCH